MIQSEIVERQPGYTNRAMVEYCELLLGIVNKQVPVKVGRGKTSAIEYQYKYRDCDATRARLEKSLDFYKIQQDMSKKFEFRPYQNDIIVAAYDILMEHGFVYLAMEVRTGKTLTSLGLAEYATCKTVLFVTKKKAMSSIQDDYEMLEPGYILRVINYESLHHVMNEYKWDMIILDEAHGLGAFAKPSERALMVKGLIAKCDPLVVLLSGTPTPESYSQMYHQVYGIPGNPFREFQNFYRFADKHVRVTQKKINGLFIKEQFAGCKIGIFYKFKEEFNALQQVFGDQLTTELSVFEDTDKNIALQIVSGREGISLKKADYLVYYNIDFSATSYWQSKDRMTTKERAFNHVYWIFSKGGIEYEIYKAVTKKKDYTVNHFKKDFYL